MDGVGAASGSTVPCMDSDGVKDTYDAYGMLEVPDADIDSDVD